MKQNCVNIEKPNNFNIQNQTRLTQDSCYLTEKEQISMGPGNYYNMNFYDCECNIPAVRELAVKQPEMTYNDGYGWSQCQIDKDSVFRNDPSRITNPRLIQQLHERPYLTVPYMSRGGFDVPTESMLTLGTELTGSKRACNTLSGIYIDRFVPQIPHIKENVQNPIHFIESDNDKTWIRGGEDSRSLIRNTDYLKKCGYEYNGKMWSRTK